MESFAKSTLVGSHDRFLWRHPPTLGPTRGSSFSIYQWGLSRTGQKTVQFTTSPPWSQHSLRAPGPRSVPWFFQCWGRAMEFWALHDPRTNHFTHFQERIPPRSARSSYYRFIARSHNLLLEWHPQIIPTQRRNDHPRLIVICSTCYIPRKKDLRPSHLGPCH